jgi:ribosomal protein L24E
MDLFKKKCKYCGSKIEKGKEVLREVKVPEFTGTRLMPFCSEEHAELYEKHIIGTPSRSSCLNCKE